MTFDVCTSGMWLLTLSLAFITSREEISPLSVINLASSFWEKALLRNTVNPASKQATISHILNNILLRLQAPVPRPRGLIASGVEFTVVTKPFIDGIAVEATSRSGLFWLETSLTVEVSPGELSEGVCSTIRGILY